MNCRGHRCAAKALAFGYCLEFWFMAVMAFFGVVGIAGFIVAGILGRIQ